MSSRPKTETIVQGIAASQGIAYGKVFLYIQSDIEVPSYQVEPEKRIDEVRRFERGVLAAREQISKNRQQVEASIGAAEAAIFDSHLMVLEDPALLGETVREFEASGRNIEACFNEVADRYVAAFAKMDDEYFRERASDIR
ncbi:MAG: hypothetical protein RLZZ15_1834, partial [Verrucomicrobiota bacterium]